MTNTSKPADQSLPPDALRRSINNSIILVETEQQNLQQARDFKQFNIKKLPLADMRVYDIVIDAISIHRRQENIDSDAVNDFFLSTLVEGEAKIKQHDAEFTVHPGELAIVSGGEPYSTNYTKPSHRLILRIPNHIFFERVLGRDICEFHARPIRSGGLLSIVFNLFKSLTLKTEQLSDTDQYTLAESFLELLSAVIRTSAIQDDQPKLVQTALMRRILTYMDENYSDCELTPEKIAIANGISMRYLHRLFQQSGMAVSKWIWERRLKATREDLLDPSKSNMRVSEIAFRRGFNDPAHFSRSFRERFDITPSKLRSKASQNIS